MGEHTLYGELHRLLRLLLHHIGILVLLEMSYPAGVPSVYLVLELLAGENRLGTVDDYNIVTAVYMRGLGGLALAVENGSGGGGDPSQRLAICVNNIPFALYILGICHECG